MDIEGDSDGGAVAPAWHRTKETIAQSLFLAQATVVDC